MQQHDTQEQEQDDDIDTCLAGNGMEQRGGATKQTEYCQDDESGAAAEYDAAMRVAIAGKNRCWNHQEDRSNDGEDCELIHVRLPFDASLSVPYYTLWHPTCQGKGSECFMNLMELLQLTDARLRPLVVADEEAIDALLGEVAAGPQPEGIAPEAGPRGILAGRLGEIEAECRLLRKKLQVNLSVATRVQGVITSIEVHHTADSADTPDGAD